MSARRDSVSKDLIFIGGLVVIAVALILYLVLGSDHDAEAGAGAAASGTSAVTDSGKVAPSEQNAKTGVERRQPGDPFALGDPDAPVALVMFSDYRCPFCAKFSRDTEPELIERFVDSGKLRIEWRDFPIFGEQSMLAARAGRAAAAQGRFWEFNRAVYAAAPERTKSELTEPALIDFAGKAGVPDIDKFINGMRGSTFDAAINADLAQGTSIGVPSTPAFLINNVPLLGAQPTDEFVRAIENAMTEP
ncbi:thioredoxin domain-containing protein [Mycolicibacterium wolinskyi]|uniref:Disulfide bond formation protein n=1 Tax=Mycolicibacterium wolinskyi TaxID=59750 RepID=A0A1X2F3B9_9MYCO|nr:MULTISPECIES: thioredoxin domain-containing protein [Mycolicibacterium]MCV7287679.1 thioredoxin domain-containing protein [Mycolicibacterium wolinskyi]MCV7294577.1 thioredoxin domain-containing protein [Mycolicibacterium goodii]ORX12539.1 disulfide bond formation protein [Mycolicibacterium wolinskyi]